VKSQKVDLETRILADIAQMHRTLPEKLLEDPSLVKVLSDVPPSERPKEQPIAYQALSMCNYIYHMKERKIISDNEWEGELR
jgi:hypothetical protein